MIGLKGILAFLMVVGTSVAQDDPPKEGEYVNTFANGAKLITRIDDGIYYRNVEGEETLIANGRTWFIPSDSQRKPKQVTLGKKPYAAFLLPKMEIQVTTRFDDRFLAVTGDGRYRFFDAYGDFNQGIAEPAYATLEYQNQNYQIVFVKFGNETRHHFYLIRGDLMIWKLGEFAAGEKRVSLNDAGLLSFGRYHPKKFQIIGDEVHDASDETAVKDPVKKSAKSAKKNEVIDEQGNLVNARDYIASHFRELVGEVKGDSTYVADPQDLTALRLALGRKESPSVVILGDSGSGKTELVRSFAAEVGKGSFAPDIPASTEIWSVNASHLVAGTRFIGVFEIRLNALIAYARENRAILFFDEMHTLRGSGAHLNKPDDFFEELKPHLRKGSIRIIGTSTEEQFDHAFGADPALRSRLSILHKKPPDPTDIPKLLQNWGQVAFGSSLAIEVAQEAIRLSEEFDAIGVQPSKATRLLSDALSQLPRDGRQSSSLTIQDLRVAANRLYQIDLAEFSPEAIPNRLKVFRARLDQRVWGLAEIKDALERTTTRILAGTHDRTKPRIRALLAGPKGLGKTHLVKAYASALGLPCKKVSMNQYLGQNAVDRLLGEVARAIQINAFTVFLFDEIEKAPIWVQDALLNLMDSDSFTLQASMNGEARGPKVGRLIRTAGASMFFTTNAGQDAVLRSTGSHGGGTMTFQPRAAALRGTSATPEEKALRDEMARDGLSEFLVDRMERILLFLPPKTTHEFKEVLGLKLAETLDAYQRDLGINVLVGDREELLDALTSKFFKAGSGYRQAIAELEDAVGFALAKHRLSNGPSNDPCADVLLGNTRGYLQDL